MAKSNAEIAEMASSLVKAAAKKENTIIGEERANVLTVIMPQEMTYKQLAAYAKQKDEEEEQLIDVSAEIFGMPTEVIVAIKRAAQTLFGMMKTLETSFFFFKIPPKLVSIETAPGVKEEFPIERITIPERLTGAISINIKDGNSVILSAEIKRKERKTFNAFVAEIEREVKENSLYRGRTFRLSAAWIREKRSFDFHKDSPVFTEVRNVSIDDVIIDDSIRRQINSAIISRIMRPDEVRRLGLNLRQGVLFYGPFGSGKTLTAMALANMANQNNWTVMFVDNPADLNEAHLLATRFEPCLIIAEEVHTVLKEGAANLDAYLTAFDGDKTKGRDVICVMTTNYFAMIAGALTRPERIDMNIRLAAPSDPDTYRRLIKKYTTTQDGKSLLDPSEDYHKSIYAMQQNGGLIPAFVKKACEMAVLASLADKGIENTVVTDDDLASVCVMAHTDQKRALKGYSEDTEVPIPPTIDLAVKEIIDRSVERWGYSVGFTQRPDRKSNG